IERIRQLQDERRVDLQSSRVREFLNPFPPCRAVDQHFGAAYERDLAVSQMVKMFERESPSRFVAYHHRADIVTGHFPTHRCGGDVSLAEVREQLDVDEEPVEYEDECADGVLQQ